MLISHIRLQNWKNFRDIDVNLGERMFLVGPNASGKSNFLDVFRFLRDIAKSGGGLQKAIQDRGGLSRIRCLAARQHPDIVIDVQLSGTDGDTWRYSIGIKQQQSLPHETVLAHEKVWHNGKVLLSRPDQYDQKDGVRLQQTHLENLTANSLFREIANYLKEINYYHLIPQLIQHPTDFPAPYQSVEDPFGRTFLKKLGATPTSTRRARLRKIGNALRYAVPQLENLDFKLDEQDGTPHLEVLYNHWRQFGAKQRENQFSDGTLRLISLLWSILDGDATLLLEEPELSLHAAIVRQLPSLIHQMSRARKRKRQLLISTHSAELLYDESLGGQEILVFNPGNEGTRVFPASDNNQIRILLENGFSVAEAVLPHTEPQDIEQLSLVFK